MIYEQSLEGVRSLLDAEGLLDLLMSKVLERGELTDLLEMTIALSRNFLAVDRVEILQFTTDGGITVSATSSNSEKLPLNYDQKYPSNYLPADRRELLRLGGKFRQQLAIDLVDNTILAYSIQTTTIGTTSTQQPQSVPQIFDREYLALLQDLGIAICLVIPIFYDDNLWGLLLCQHTEAKCFDFQQRQTLQAIGERLSFAITQDRLLTCTQSADRDVLTGLPNRLLFQRKLSLALAEMPAIDRVLAIVFIDLDRFKTINDSLGHTVGDRFLQLIARRLQDSFSNIAVVARWSGDEFALLIPKLSNVQAVIEIADLVLNCFETPFIFDRDFITLKTNLLHIKASMGIAITSDCRQDSETLLKQADAALYQAKHNGKNNYEIYSPIVSHTSTDRLRLENILYRAIEHDRLILHYQPQIDVQTGKVSGVESLLRCQDRYAKLISPADFIPIAEETGAIDRIGEWVLRVACAQNKLWQQMDLGYFPIAVNLSVRQLQNQTLVDTITTILAETGLAPIYLELEITESIAIKDLDLTIRVLESLRTIGVKISLDDFGTGYSSLAALKYLPLDRLKIDRSFIRELKANTIDAGIVKTIVNLGHELDLTTIAEGVETVEQFEFLRSIHCDAVQGFLFSRPLPASDLEPLMINGGNWKQNLTNSLFFCSTD
jgi:diguanylate cyclase (GGDEF)-like protein